MSSRNLREARFSIQRYACSPCCNPVAEATSLMGTGFYQQHLLDQLKCYSTVLKGAYDDAVQSTGYDVERNLFFTEGSHAASLHFLSLHIMYKDSSEVFSLKPRPYPLYQHM